MSLYTVESLQNQCCKIITVKDSNRLPDVIKNIYEQSPYYESLKVITNFNNISGTIRFTSDYRSEEYYSVVLKNGKAMPEQIRILKNDDEDYVRIKRIGRGHDNQNTILLELIPIHRLHKSNQDLYRYIERNLEHDSSASKERPWYLQYNRR